VARELGKGKLKKICLDTVKLCMYVVHNTGTKLNGKNPYLDTT